MKRLIILFLMCPLILSGCASAPVKKVEKKRETVFYPPLPQSPKLQFLTSISKEEDLGKHEERKGGFREFLLGKKEKKEKKELQRAYDLGVTKGKIYVVDRYYKKIIIVDLVKKRFDYIKSEGMGAIMSPTGIWVTEKGEKYIVDTRRSQVLEYSADDTFVRAYGEKGQFVKPVDAALFGNILYVSDFGRNKVLAVDRNSGKTVREIGGEGKGEDVFHKPTQITVDNEGTLYVNDAFGFRIAIFDKKGKFLRSIGKIGDLPGNFARPKSVVVDREGHLYVTDAAFERIQVFDGKTGRLLLWFGHAGNNPGDLYLPAGMFIDYENVPLFKKYVDKNFKVKYLLFVANQYGSHMVNVYGFGEWIGPPLPEIPLEKDKEKMKEKDRGTSGSEEKK